ncbi:uncharacterized protein AAES06_024972 [Glossophaga mutica]
MQLLLILMALLLPPGAGAEEIIGGREARPHSHPYMAYLLIQTPMEVFACGGFLVRKDFVMTAAHCLGSTITVILGAHNISREERTQQRISVLRAIPHPAYNEDSNLNDIMLLQLRNRARKNRFVRPVALPRSQAQLRPGSQCTVAGWGLVSQNTQTDTLRDVQLKVQSNQLCSNLFHVYNGQKEICVGNQTERKTAFKGDSGGPLVCNNVAQGIVSYGSNTGTPPAVFTKVSSYLPWINRTMRRFKTVKNQKSHHTTPPMMDSSLGQNWFCCLAALGSPPTLQIWGLYLVQLMRATRHPGYNEENNLNDIMLLQLENRARQNQFVRPVALPQSRTEPRPGSRCTVAGWGLVSQNRRTDTLRDVQLSVQRDQVCSNLFNTCNGQKQICVGDQSDVETAFKKKLTMGSITRKMQVLLLWLVFLLPPEAGAGEIIGGTESEPHSHPYMAYLKITDRDRVSTCGGFLISEEFVLTAAHCKGRNITVTLGAHDMKQEESTWQKLEVKKQFVHPKYSFFTYRNDIMLLKLQKKAELNHAVGTIPLPSQSTFIPPGTECQVTGWGRTGMNEPTSDTLREVKLTVMNAKACRRFFFYSNNLQICVGDPTKKGLPYKGDSGGPLLCAGVAQGVVSHIHLNAKPPAVFTRISAYVSWINQILESK